jgi:hypothetical protein
MPTLVQVNEPNASERQVYFDIRADDGVSPINSEAGNQPQISINGTAWTDSGIGTLNLIGNGRYYAVLDISSVVLAGSKIESRYKGALTVETPGDSVQVVGFDPKKPFYAAGDGTVNEVVTIETENQQPISGVDVWVTSDEAGLYQVAGVLETDAQGQVIFQLDPGTYYLWRQHPNYNFANPKTMVVS